MTAPTKDAPVLVAITGATGVVFGIETVRALREIGIPVHLVVSEMGARTLAYESDVSLDGLKALADVTYANKDVGEAVASGSFRTRGMIVAPCSIKTLSGIAHSFDHNLVIRAADVTLKERRPLVLLIRETPLHKGHIALMAQAADSGAIIMPPVPAFYHKPSTIMDIVHHTVGRALDALGIEHDLLDRWSGCREEIP